MEIKEFKIRLGEVLDQEDDLIDRIEKETIRLAESGGIDLESEDNFAIVKTCLYVALKNQVVRYEPLTEDYRKIANNLEHF